MKLLVVEDDWRQSATLIHELKEEFLGIDIELIETESDFRANFNALVENPPDIVIMDVMIKWTTPSANVAEVPKEILDAGFYRAGIRCTKMLLENERLAHIPIIIHSVLSREDLKDSIAGFRQSVVCFPKGNSPNQLTNLIRSLLPGL